MKTTTEKTFDTVNFFRNIKAKLAEKLATMSLEEQKEFLKKVRDGEIKIVWSTLWHNERTAPSLGALKMLHHVGGPGNETWNWKIEIRNFTRPGRMVQI